jgi:hypothetical protein
MTDDGTAAGDASTPPDKIEPQPDARRRRASSPRGKTPAPAPADKQEGLPAVAPAAEAATAPLDAATVPLGTAAAADTARLDTTPGGTTEMPSATADTVALPAVESRSGAGSPPAATTAGDQRRPARWRRIVAVVLIVLATLLAPLTLAVLWMNHDLLNTDNYVAAVAPLSSNPAVQDAIATDVTDQLWAKVDVQQQLAGVLPSWAQVFSAPLSNQLKTYAYQAIHAIVASPQFSKVWEVANRQAHARVTDALLGNKGHLIGTSNGEVSIDLTPAVDKVKAALDAKGIHALDTVATTPGSATFVLFRSETLAKAQKTINFFHKLSVALPLLLIAAWAGAIAVSWRRRRTVLQLGFLLALAMVLTLIGYHLGRGAYLNAVVSQQLPRPAASAIFDALLVGVLTAARTVLVVGLVIWLGALLAGPAGWAVWVRRAVAGVFQTAGTAAEQKGLDLGPVGSWVARHHGPLQIAGVLIAAAVLVFWGTPGVAGVLWIVVGLLVYLAIVEFVGRLTRPKAGDAVAPRADAP